MKLLKLVKIGFYKKYERYVINKFKFDVLPYRYYSDIPNFLRKMNESTTPFNSVSINCFPRFSKGEMMCISFQNCNIVLDGEIINITPGTMFMVSSLADLINTNIPKHLLIVFFNSNLPKLSVIMRKIETRLELKDIVRDFLLNEKITKYRDIQIEKSIGSGNYGNVFQSRIFDIPVAIKKLKCENSNELYSYKNNEWYEYYILTEILSKIVENKICPNLPIIYDSLFDKDIVSIVERADGNLKDYLSENPSEQELMSAFFQILAGIYSFQLYGQIMHFDIKKENILYFKIKPGGYFLYKILNNDYYVPNLGFLFVVNDFNISRTLSPSFQLYKKIRKNTFRLGHRYGIIIDNKIQPIQGEHNINDEYKITEAKTVKWRNGVGNGVESNGIEVILNKESQEILNKIKLVKHQKEYLKSKGHNVNIQNPNFYLNPLIPPFEFYNDTQDALRMIIGGKRTTQKGNHERFENAFKFCKKMEQYIGVGDNLNAGIFSENPAEISCGYLIQELYGDSSSDYLIKANKRVIDEFNLNI